MTPQRRPISRLTVSRREVLAWLGDGFVLALGSAALATACRAGTSGAAAEPDLGSPAEDPATDTGIAGGDDVAADAAAGAFAFAPGALDGIHERWPERTIDRQEVAAILASWELLIDGLVARPLTLSFADLVSLERTDLVADFHCVEGWSVLDVPWNGVRLSQLLDSVEPLAAATHVAFHTVGDRYNGSLPLAVAREPHTLLGYGVGGATLPLPRGFPVRVVVPRLLGYKNPKYVERVELTDAAEPGYWVRVGYPYDGEVPAGRLREGRY